MRNIAPPRRGGLTAGLAVILLLASVGAVSAAKPPKPPSGLAATAFVSPTVQYLNDTAGTVFTFSIRNTGTVGIGAVEFARPSTSWLVTACPSAPTGWATQRSDNFCRYRSAAGSADDLAQGTLTSTFQLRATTAAGTADRTGTWSIHVSSSNGFDAPNKLKPAPAEAPGLTITAFSFQITDAVVASGNAGDPCPAPTAENHSAITGSTQTILVCGRNRMTVSGTPTAALSSLGGTFIADDGTFSSGSIPADSANQVIATWTGAQVTSMAGAGKTIVAKVGSAADRNSPITTLDDVCGASPAFQICIANGGYEALNQPPDAVDDTADASEDGPSVAIDVLANDSDPDGDPIEITSTGGSPLGLVTITGAGTGIDYDPNGQFESLKAGATATDTFTYSIEDPFAASDTATVTVTIMGENDPPVADDDAYSVAEDGNLTVPAGVGVLAGDTDVEGDALTAGSPAGLSNGSLTLNADGSFTYTPNADFNGTDSFTYTVSDGNGGTDTGAVTITVTAGNDPPVADDDLYSVAEDGTLTVPAGTGVLAGDTDIDGDPLTAGSPVGPTNGGLTLDADGSFTYTPNADFNGTDSFTYTVSDGNGGIDTGAVTITVGPPVNDPPVADDDAYSVAEDGNLTVPAGVGVLAGDTDVEGDALTAGSPAGLSNGSLTLNADGSFTYTPNADFNGTDSFTYTVSDGNGGTDTGAVTITVTAGNDAPVADDDADDADEGGPAIIVDVLANDSDVDSGDVLVVNAVDTTGTTGLVTNNGTDITYDPNGQFESLGAGETTTDTFTYTVSDGNGGTDTATVTVTIHGQNDPPTANDDADSTSEFADVDIDVLANDTDPDASDTLVVNSVDTTATIGLVTNNGTDITYDPNGQFDALGDGESDTDTFTYTISDGNGGTDTAVVTVTINGSTDVPPTATDDSAPVVEDSGANAIDVLANDTDLDGGPKTISMASDPANGTVAITGGGSGLTYAPDPNYCNVPPGTTPDTFTYTLNGGSTATVSITVTCVDDPPTATDDSATVGEDSGANAIDALANDTDLDGGPKTISMASDPANGTVAITGGGTGLTYAPDPNYCNDQPGTTPDTFTYTLTGGSTATVSMTVTCVDDDPVADDETFDGANGAIGNTSLVVNDPTDGAPALSSPKKSITGDVLDGDVDVDGPGPLEVAPGTFATNDGGSVTIQADGDFIFDPATSTSCTDTSDFFDYTLVDAGSPPGSTDVGRVTISIAGCVWYVSNNAVGNSGTSRAPFDTLAQAETASGADHTVFVFDGDNTSTGYGGDGYAMNSGERLIGEHEGLIVDPDGGGSLGPVNLQPANPGAHPTLTATDADVISLDDANEVRGFNLDPSGTGGGIAGAAGDTGGGTFDDVNVLDSGTAGTQPGLELDSTTGTFNVSNLAVVTNGATGVRLNNAGTVNFASTGTISIATSGSSGLTATGTNMGTSVFDAITVTGSGVGGVSMTSTTGTTTFGDLSLTTTSGATSAFALSNAGTISVPAAGTANLSATGGPVVDVTGTAGATLAFDTVSSTNSSTDGINLAGLGAGTFSATGGTIAGAAGFAFDLDGGSGAIDYPGALNNGTGATAEVTNRSGGAVTLSGFIADTNDAGGGITVSGNTGGSTTFSGASKVLNTGAQPAVSLSSNPGHTINLNGGGLDIDTTAGAGLSATGGGTVQVTAGASPNTIDTGTGTAATVTSTTISNAGVTFQSVSSNGGTTGIVLTTTGNSGSFVVTGSTAGACGTAGTIADCSGGTITGKSGDAISLSSTLSPSFTRMNLANNNGSGVSATGVSALTVAHSRIDDSGDTAGIFEAGISLTNVTGTTSVSSSTISHSFDSNVHWNISSGTGTVTVASSNVGPTNTDGTLGNSGIQIVGTGTGAGTLNVTGSTFDDNNAMGVGTSMANTSALTLNVSTSTFTDNNMAVAVGVVDDADVTFDINGNTALRSETNAFQVLSGETSNTGSDVTGIIRNNTIGDANADSGARDLHGIAVELNDDADGVISILNNTIQHVDQHGIFVTTRDLTGTDPTPNDATLDVHIRDNAISSIDDNSIVPIGLVYGTLIDARSASNMCLDINSNDSANIAAQDVRVRQRDTSVFRLERFVGNGALVTDVEAFVVAQNDPGTTADATLATSFTGVADGTCRDP